MQRKQNQDDETMRFLPALDWNETVRSTLQLLLNTDCLQILLEYGGKIEVNNLISCVEQSDWNFTQVLPFGFDQFLKTYDHWLEEMQISHEERTKKEIMYSLIYFIQENNEDAVRRVLNYVIRNEVANIFKEQEAYSNNEHFYPRHLDLITFFILIAECSWNDQQNQNPLTNRNRWMSFIMWILFYFRGMKNELKKYAYNYERLFVPYALISLISESIYLVFFDLDDQLNSPTILLSSLLTTTTKFKFLNKYITRLFSTNNFEKIREEACVVYKASWHQIVKLLYLKKKHFVVYSMQSRVHPLPLPPLPEQFGGLENSKIAIE